MTKPMDQRGIVNFSANLLGRYPVRSFWILSAFLLAGVMEGLSAGMLLPLLTQMQNATVAGTESGQLIGFFDQAFGYFGANPTIGALLVMIIILFLIKAVLQFLAMREVGNGTATMTAELREDLIGALMKARWPHFAGLSSGQVTTSLISEADRAALSYLHLCKMLADIILVTIYLFIALFISWPVTLAACIGGCILMVALHRLVNMVRQAGREQTELFRTLSAIIGDALLSFKPIKAMGRVDYFHTVLKRDTRRLWNAKKREVMGTEIMASARDPLLICFVAAGLYVSYTYAGLSLSALLVLAFMFLRVVQKLTIIQQGYQRVVSQESAYWAIVESTQEAVRQQEVFVGQIVPTLKSFIRLDNVTFYHSRNGMDRTRVLDNVNCMFPVNSFNAIIGPSGSGKTTLLDLVLGFYKPESGRLLVDDVPLDDLDIAAWRDMIGYIPQEGFLLHDSVRNNITLGQDMTDAHIMQALAQAGIDDFIRSLPDGLDTVAGERGQMFSGGQRQRITLARALARSPSVLLLDEPTSALDPDTEKALLDTLRLLARRMTIIVISHSERVKAYADHVLVLEHGRIMPQQGHISQSQHIRI